MICTIQSLLEESVKVPVPKLIAVEIDCVKKLFKFYLLRQTYQIRGAQHILVNTSTEA